MNNPNIARAKNASPGVTNRTGLVNADGHPQGEIGVKKILFERSEFKPIFIIKWHFVAIQLTLIGFNPELENL
jgi:hypothetical protein